MSNSNYSIGLQRLKPVYTAYCGLHNLAENWSWARYINDRDVDNFSRDETRRWYVSNVSRPRRRDPDHNSARVTSHVSLDVSFLFVSSFFLSDLVLSWIQEPPSRPIVLFVVCVGGTKPAQCSPKLDVCFSHVWGCCGMRKRWCNYRAWRRCSGNTQSSSW